MKFNRSRFNVGTANKIVLTGESILNLSTNNPSLKVVKRLNGSSELNLFSEAKMTVGILFESSQITEMNMDTEAKMTSIVKMNALAIEMVLDSSAISNMKGEDTLTINGVKLLPGQSVEISLCDLTVTENGENILDLVTDESEWFELLRGKNSIEITTDNGTSVDVEVFWKDRWL